MSGFGSIWKATTEALGRPTAGPIRTRAPRDIREHSTIGTTCTLKPVDVAISEILWAFEVGGHRHQLTCLYDSRADTLALRLDRQPIGDLLDAHAWRSGATLRSDVDGAVVTVAVRSRAVAMIPPTDVPFLRAWLDGRPLISQEAREFAVLMSMLSFILPILLAIGAVTRLPPSLLAPGLVLVAATGTAWVFGIPWWARRQWVEMAPYGRARGLPWSVPAFAMVIFFVEAALLGAIFLLPR